MNHKDFTKPIICDNRNLRKEVSVIENYFKVFQQEIKSFPKENDIILDLKLVNFVNCPVCGSNKNSQLFIKFGFIYVECIVCSHVFVYNKLKEDILLDLYSKSISDQLNRQVQNSQQYHNYWIQIYDKYLEYLQIRSLDNRNLLDIGCGSGKFLTHCTNLDFILHAIDFCQDTFEYIVKLIGRERYYFKQKIENIDFGSKKFGLITLWGVFEHLAHPLKILTKCHDILSDSGRIIILIPNLYSRAFKILGINVPTINPRAHINFYTEASFAYLCAKTNFSIVDFFQELPVIDLMYPYIIYNDKLINDILQRRESYYQVYILKKN